ncbi:GIY-YIG nuclease family protein [Azospirillum sp. sgz302134]
MGEDRKAAVAAYKERKAVAGVYAVRCAPSGTVWVGTAPDLGKIQNRLWFEFRLKGSPHRTLQAAWDEHGPDAFTFEVMESLKEETLPFARKAELKARLQHWSEALGAEAL